MWLSAWGVLNRNWPPAKIKAKTWYLNFKRLRSDVHIDLHNTGMGARKFRTSIGKPQHPVCNWINPLRVLSNHMLLDKSPGLSMQRRDRQIIIEAESTCTYTHFFLLSLIHINTSYMCLLGFIRCMVQWRTCNQFVWHWPSLNRQRLITGYYFTHFWRKRRKKGKKRRGRKRTTHNCRFSPSPFLTLSHTHTYMYTRDAWSNALQLRVWNNNYFVYWLLGNAKQTNKHIHSTLSLPVLQAIIASQSAKKYKMVHEIQ